MPEPGAERPTAGLAGALSGMIATAVALLRTRLELATVEFEEERERIKIMLVLIVGATMFACFALVTVSVWVVACLWESHPLAAIAGVAIFHALVAGGAVLALKQQVKAHGRPFAATLAELERDADAIRRKP
ncbi:MAG: phage holin family protein [Pseudomonadota bacterium]|nr:phage holin family protein [Pseudomonadota bacterium]